MKSETFAQRLKKAMNNKGLKQIDIVNKTNMDKTLLNKYLKGISEPKQDNLTLLSEILDVNEVWLMGYDVPMESEPLELKKFLDDIEYDDIEKIVKNDTEKTLISYIDFLDIIIYIYSDKSLHYLDELIETLEDAIMGYKALVTIEENNTQTDSSVDIKLNNEIKDLQKHNAFILFNLKKYTLFSNIKTYYTKKDILRNIDKRNIFDIKDKNNIKVENEEIRLNIIEKYLNNMVNTLKYKNKDK